MDRDGFTLIEAILLLFISTILIVPSISIVNNMVGAREATRGLHRQFNKTSELVEMIYYEEPVELLRGVSYESEGFLLEAIARQGDDILEEKKSRIRRGKNLYDYRRLDIDVSIYAGEELVMDLQLYRFGIETEEEKVFYKEEQDRFER